METTDSWTVHGPKSILGTLNSTSERVTWERRENRAARALRGGGGACKLKEQANYDVITASSQGSVRTLETMASGQSVG